MDLATCMYIEGKIVLSAILPRILGPPFQTTDKANPWDVHTTTSATWNVSPLDVSLAVHSNALRPLLRADTLHGISRVPLPLRDCHSNSFGCTLIA